MFFQVKDSKMSEGVLPDLTYLCIPTLIRFTGTREYYENNGFYKF